MDSVVYSAYSKYIELALPHRAINTDIYSENVIGLGPTYVISLQRATASYEEKQLWFPLSKGK